MDLGQLADPAIAQSATSGGVILVLWRLGGSIAKAMKSLAEAAEAVTDWASRQTEHQAAESAHWERVESLMASPRPARDVDTARLVVAGEVLQ